MKRIILFILLGLLFNTCLQDAFEYPPTFCLIPSSPPFQLSSNKARFYKDLKYGIDQNQAFDIFLPGSKKPSSLCIFIHGGGFMAGDKIDFYSNFKFTVQANNLIAHNIAVASINYRLLQPNEVEGLLKCLMDVKRALQTIRYYSNILHIEKSKVILIGNSAGAGAALWIGLNEDFADFNFDNPIQRESTRVKGLICIGSQASYDFIEWQNDVFYEYIKDGFNYKSINTILTEPLILSSYGISNKIDLDSKEIIEYRNSVNMLNLMSEDDPEIYIMNTGIKNSIPVNMNQLTHHPLHLKALYDRSILVNLTGYFYSPELGIDTTKGLTIEEFILNKLSE